MIRLFLPAITLAAMTPLTLLAAAAPTRNSAERVVHSVLQREVDAGVADRAEALQGVARSRRATGAIRWQTGQVRFGRGWSKFESVPKKLAGHKIVRQYRQLRERALKTRDGQLALADWCRRNNLPLRERAHLNAALELSENRDEPVIRKRLGFVNVNNEWVHRDKLIEQKQTSIDDRKQLVQWLPRVQAWFAKTRKADRDVRDPALRKLRGIQDPTALPALEYVLAKRDVASARLHVDILKNMKTHKAADALGKVAVGSKWESVRKAAALSLRSRPIEAFAPELLALLKLPIDSNVSITRDRTGVHLVHNASQETQSKRRAVFERTTVRGNQQQRGPGRRTKALDRLLNPAARLQERADKLEAHYAKLNDEIRNTNARVCAVLKDATGLQIDSTPQDWWEWWRAYNQLTKSTKQYRALHYYETRLASIPGSRRRLAIPSKLPPLPPVQEQQLQRPGNPLGPAIQSFGTPKDCLVKGTLIWTDRGRIAVETVQVGDLVLAKHPETGELSYKPVLRTSKRSPEPTVTVTTRGGDIRATGGHAMWISGRGWTKFRDIKQGQRLHGANGSSQILKVKTTARAETFNLLVADFHTYFVGPDATLSHDMTFAEPTDVLVPGLPRNFRSGR